MERYIGSLTGIFTSAGCIVFYISIVSHGQIRLFSFINTMFLLPVCLALFGSIILKRRYILIAMLWLIPASLVLNFSWIYLTLYLLSLLLITNDLREKIRAIRKKFP